MPRSIPSEKGLIQSVDRSLQILMLFNDNANKELSIREISDQLSLNKSTAFCLLQTMKARGFIQQNSDNNKYSMGLQMLGIGLNMYSNLDIRSVAHPYLEKLVDTYSETAHLVIQDGDKVVYIDKITASNAVGIISHIGKHNPMYCTGVGKCILAFNPPEDVERILSKQMMKFTDNTITDKDQLHLELEKIRRLGYGVDNEEIEQGLCCIAAPIFDYRHKVAGAVSLSGPTTRMTEEKIASLVEPVKSCADSISYQLGFSPNGREHSQEYW